jgi:hypothetical protein
MIMAIDSCYALWNAFKSAFDSAYMNQALCEMHWLSESANGIGICVLVFPSSHCRVSCLTCLWIVLLLVVCLLVSFVIAYANRMIDTATFCARCYRDSLIRLHDIWVNVCSIIVSFSVLCGRYQTALFSSSIHRVEYIWLASLPVPLGMLYLASLLGIGLSPSTQ